MELADGCFEDGGITVKRRAVVEVIVVPEDDPS